MERLGGERITAPMLQILRYVWPLPWTLVGLTAAALVRLGGGQWQRRDGALEAFGGAAGRLARRLPAPMRFDAITLGHVIIAVDRQAADGARCHEHVHIRQYERWGALFVPAYLAASVWQGLRGGAPYRDNVFEREAYAASPISSMLGACAGMGKVK